MKIIKFGSSITKVCPRMKEALSKMEEPYPIEVVNAHDDKSIREQYGLIVLPVHMLVDDEGKEVKRYEGLGSVADYERFVS